MSTASDTPAPRPAMRREVLVSLPVSCRAATWHKQQLNEMQCMLGGREGEGGQQQACKNHWN